MKWYATLGAAAAVIAMTACGPEPFEFEKEAGVEAPEIPAEAGDTISAAVREPNAYARATRLAALLANAGAEAIPEVKATLETPFLSLGGVETELLLRFWATHDPEAATRWAVDWSAIGYRFAAVLITTEMWAQQDPLAVLKEDSEVWRLRKDISEAAQVGLVRGWFERDPADLARHIQELGMGVQGQRLLSAFVKVMIRRMGSDATIRWAESVPEDDDAFKLAVYRQVSSSLAFLDHQASLRFCETHCDGPFGKDLRTSIATRWARREGAPALEWLADAPESYDRNLGLRAAFADWGQTDRDAALAWMGEKLKAEPGAEWQAPILPVYSRLLSRVDPATAIEVAERIEKEEDREWILVEVARRWRAVDDPAAQAWLEKSNLSEESRQKVAAPLPQPPLKPAS